MNPLPEPALERMVLRHATDLMQRFVPETTTFDAGRARLEWNGRFRRYDYEQTLVLWRDFDEVEFTLAPGTNRIMSFRDRRRLEATGEQRLDGAALLAIARTTGLVGDGAEALRVKAGPLYRFEIVQSGAGLPRRIAMTVNAVKRLCAAFEVLEDAP